MSRVYDILIEEAWDVDALQLQACQALAPFQNPVGLADVTWGLCKET